ncbi:MAG: zinc-dependent metalloprotease family protein [Acidobacteriota bacterium]
MPPIAVVRRSLLVLLVATLLGPPLLGSTAGPLLTLDPGTDVRARTEAVRAVAVEVDLDGWTSSRARSVHLPLFDGRGLDVDFESVAENRSGSRSWVGRIRGDDHGLVVLVTRGDVAVASVRTGGDLFMLYPAGRGENGRTRHGLYEIDEASPRFHEAPPTPIHTHDLAPLSPRRTATPRAGKANGDTNRDDGSVHDLMVVYTQHAIDEVGGLVPLETLIDLGVTETNLSYEASGVDHRVALVHTSFIEYDEFKPTGIDARDHLQDPDDGVMDEVHPLRDRYGADLVMLLLGRSGCGRAFIMAEVDPAFEAFAFCRVSQICVSPGYTFQHELGHLAGGRHQWNGDPANNAPFTFNHGYLDAVNEFRTIMAGNDILNCPDCTRRLRWSNPDIADPVTGAPMGIPEGEPMACDNRKTLNATALTIANFRQSVSPIFSDDFESGGLDAWSQVDPPPSL